MNVTQRQDVYMVMCDTMVAREWLLSLMDVVYNHEKLNMNCEDPIRQI